MARVKFGKVTRSRRKRWIKRAKGYYGLKKNSYKKAHEQVIRSMAYAFVGRKERKRDFRKLWIVRINAAVRPYELSYSRFMFGLKQANIGINRKMLSELAINSPGEFEKIVNIAQKHLNVAETHLDIKVGNLPKTKMIMSDVDHVEIPKVSQPTPPLSTSKVKTVKPKPAPKAVEKELAPTPTPVKKTKTASKKPASKLDENDPKVYLKSIEKKYAVELKPLPKVDADGNPVKKITKKMTVEERAALDNSNLISEERSKLEACVEQIRLTLNSEDREVFTDQLSSMTNRELIKYARKMVNKVSKYEK